MSLEIQNSFNRVLPEGWTTTLQNARRIQNLSTTYNEWYDESLNPKGEWSDHPLGGVVEDMTIQDETATLREHHIVLNAIEEVRTAFETPERVLPFPGMELNKKFILAWAIEYKKDNDTPSGLILNNKLATNDDLVIEFATPEVYSDSGNSTADNFIQTGLSAGNEVDLVGADGVGGSNELSLADHEQYFFTGDFVDADPSNDAVITAYQFAQVDGEGDYGITDATIQERVSNLNTALVQGAIVKSDVDINAKVYDGGDAEVIPGAFRLASGSNATSLTN